MSVEIGFKLIRCDEPVRKDAVAMEFTGRMLSKTVLTVVALTCDLDATTTVWATVFEVEPLGYHLHSAVLNVKVSEIQLACLVLHRQDT